jgi:hypothetical protein
MTPGRIACALAVLAVFCVLAIFFIPGHDGPYPAVHGPVTALLSIRAAARLRVIIRAGVRAVQNCAGRASLALVRLSPTSSLSAEFPLTIPLTGRLSVLRC